MTRWRGLGAVVAASVLVLLAACVQAEVRNPATPTQSAPTSTPTVMPTPQPTEAPTATPTSQPGEITPTPTATATASATPTATTQPVSASTVQSFGLFLKIEGIVDQSVVRGDAVIARGQTTPDALVSINGVIVPVDSDGNFEVLLALEPGPNEIVVIASDLDGNEQSRVLAIVSLPEDEVA